MFRETQSANARKSRRLLGIELLEPRTMLSATQLLTVQLPPVAASLAGLVATPNVVVGPGGGGVSPQVKFSGPYTPADIRSIYGFDKLSYNGTGQTIAIVDAYDDPTIVSDLHVFDHQFGLSDPNLTIVKQNNGGQLPTYNAGWANEIALDVEWAHAIAPAANIVLCEAADATQLFSMVDFARNYAGVGVVSMSWGEGEPSPSQWGVSSESDLDKIFTTPNGHRPVTFIAATGDNGVGTSYPSVSPNVLAVGGTSLTANVPIASGSITYGTESAWSGSGGGISAYESRPAYQAGVQGSLNRTVPDVAYDADPNTGFWVFNSAGGKGWEILGGTSAAAPQWAGLIALANQARANWGGETLANTVSDIYALPAADFHDITSGNNGFYYATPGYDEVTGRGTPVANLIINGLINAEGLIAVPVGPLGPPATSPVEPSPIYAAVVVGTAGIGSGGASTAIHPAALVTPNSQSPQVVRPSGRVLPAADELADALFGNLGR